MKDFKRERQYFSLVSTCIIFIILQSWWIAALKCPLRTKVTESKRFVSKVQLYLPPPPPLTNKLMQIDSISLCLSFKNPLSFIPVWQWQIVAEVEHSKHKLFDYTPSPSLQCQIKKKKEEFDQAVVPQQWNQFAIAILYTGCHHDGRCLSVSGPSLG